MVSLFAMFEGTAESSPFLIACGYLLATALPVGLGVALAPLPRRLMLRLPVAGLYLVSESFLIAVWLIGLEAAGLTQDIF